MSEGCDCTDADPRKCEAKVTPHGLLKRRLYSCKCSCHRPGNLERDWLFYTDYWRWFLEQGEACGEGEL